MEDLPTHLHNLFKRSCNKEEMNDKEIQEIYQLLKEFNDVLVRNDLFRMFCSNKAQ